MVGEKYEILVGKKSGAKRVYHLEQTWKYHRISTVLIAPYNVMITLHDGWRVAEPKRTRLRRVNSLFRTKAILTWKFPANMFRSVGNKSGQGTVARRFVFRVVLVVAIDSFDKLAGQVGE